MSYRGRATSGTYCVTKNARYRAEPEDEFRDRWMTGVRKPHIEKR